MLRQETLAAQAIDIVLAERPQRATRLELGEVLRRMFHADVFVSYVNDGSGPYGDPVQLNMGAGQLDAYEQHYRHVDALTPQLFSAGQAAPVVVDASGAGEFASDFLRPQNMHHGLNYFPRGSELGAIDLRLWRGRRDPAFTGSEVDSFRAFGDLLSKFWPRPGQDSPAALTPRELQITELVAEGLGDKQIAERLGISKPTLRTHLGHAFEKTGSVNRVALARYFLQHHH